MVNKKYFVIKKGFDPIHDHEITNQIIYGTWDEVKKFVQGIKGAVYKSFSSKEKANEFLAIANFFHAENLHENQNTYDPDTLYCYVDGSFNEKIPNYSYGVVYVTNNKMIDFDYGLGNNKEAISMRQIAGELLGAMKALLFAKKHGFTKVVILHDYQGVAYHATGEWKRTNAFSKDYYTWMQTFMKKNSHISISFSKVDAHTGNEFNEIADGLAKKAVFLSPNKIFFQLAQKHPILKDRGIINE